MRITICVSGPFQMKGTIMTEQIGVPRAAVGDHRWRVTFAGMGINLALGI